MSTDLPQHDFQTDLDRVARIAAVPTILDVVCRSTGMRFATVARVTEDRWVACSVLDRVDFGLKPGDELKIETTLCRDVRQDRAAVVIDDAAQDAQFRSHPVPALYGFRAYVSVPIVLADGSFFGTLCGLDPLPARVSTAETVGMFKLFAELIASHLDADRALAVERSAAELREQFLALLGHDLRNPAMALLSGTKLLQRSALDPRAATIVDMMQESARRMSALIDDVVDLARGRLGGGLTLDRREAQALAPVLHGVVAEASGAHPDRAIETDIALPATIACDPGRIGQLVANLLTNALTYSGAATPIRLRAGAADGTLEISVANAGDPIPPAALEKIFEPYYRGTARSNRQGLGLGLYIAAEIARAHGGTLQAQSTPEETRFTFRMPLTQARPAEGVA